MACDGDSPSGAAEPAVEGGDEGVEDAGGSDVMDDRDPEAGEGEGEGEPDPGGLPPAPALPTPPTPPAAPAPFPDLDADCPAAGEVFPPEERITELAAPNDGPRLYVDPTAGPGGDGTRDRPFRSIVSTFSDDPQEGLIVVLGEGEYRSGLALGQSMALLGVCPGRTVFIEAGADPPEGWGAFHIAQEGGVVLANFTLRPSSIGVSIYLPEAPVYLRRVVIEEAVGAGVHLIDNVAEVRLEEVRIHAPGPSGQAGRGEGIGVGSSSDGPLSLRQVWVSDAGEMGVSKFGLGRLEAQDLRVTHSLQGPVTLGWGVFVASGEAVIERVEIDGALDYGLLVSGPDFEDEPVAEVADLVVRRVRQGVEGDQPGVGVEVSDGGRLTLQRAVVEGIDDRGVLVRSGEHPTPATLIAGDLVVRDVRATAAGSFGAGVVLQDGVAAELRRTIIDGIAGLSLLALSILDDSPTLDAEDLVVRNGRSALNRDEGRGLALWDGTQATLRRVLVEDVLAGGVWISGWGRSPETDVAIEDLTVRRVADAECNSLPMDDPWVCLDEELRVPAGGGLGVLVHFGGRARLQRFDLRTAAMAGLVLGPDAVVRADDGVITENAIGLNHLGDPDDLEDWFDEVLLFDNGVDVAREHLPVPNPAGLIDR